ncbi:Oidioi.mRNA.OKI2018_I69.PAR.g8541.t1.cds [Oikopleura dioica]|uniref:Oidioi.mRNA.OKI2018_I69.PAR.g8541.t1.cds n=1 Tax=Oikopleura dioica TaxID=34765 RepID=A0ABN7RGG9_OIKDI|nr:Oidioi.mRNA.OKI2018_I69.PAR.g8541.t1.cds [Oikopleura dioica]
MKLFASLSIFSLSVNSYYAYAQRDNPICDRSNTGKRCLAWDSSRRYPQECNGRYASGGCSNPDNDSNGPWCYTSYANTGDYWEYCDSACASHDLCGNQQPTISPPSSGKCSHTNEGTQCRNWKNSVNMSRNRSTQRWMRNQDHNNCANPDNDSKGDWCFIEAFNGSQNYGYCPKNCRLPSPRPSSTKPLSFEQPKCAPLNENLFRFRDHNGVLSKPTTWEVPDQTPGVSFMGDMYGPVCDLGSVRRAEKGQLPWQVQLVGPFLCGGTITAPRIVITANQCVDNAINPRRWSVQAGHIEKSNSWIVSDGAQRKRILKIETTGKFNIPRQLNNDIAIMVTDTAFQFNDYVKPACLPPKNFKPVGGYCFISGWDHTASGGHSSDRLLWDLIPLYERIFCSEKLGSTLTDNMICGGGSGICQTDSGNPLVCALRHSTGANQYVLAGVNSWGGCGESPRVYCEVADHVDWINRITAQFP